MSSKYITLNRNIDLKRHINSDEYRFFLAGSDQIWRLDFAVNDYFFLDFAEPLNITLRQTDGSKGIGILKPQKRITFAASIGYEVLLEYVMERYIKYWKNMRYISVREESAAKLIG